MTIAVSDLTGSLTGILKEDYDLDIEKEERLKEKYELQFKFHRKEFSKWND